MQQVVRLMQAKRVHPARRARLCLSLMALTAMFFGSAVSAFANGGEVVWSRVDRALGKQQGVAVARDGNGNLIVSGYQNLGTGTNDDFYTVKFNTDGSVAWRSAPFDKSGSSDQPVAVAVDLNDDVIVSGFVTGSNRNIQTIKYSGANGSILWQHEYNGSANGNDLATAVSVAVDGSNNIFVGGYSQNSSGNNDMVILKYLPSGPVGGAPSWKAAYTAPFPGNSSLASLAAGSDGIVACGQSWNGTTFDFITVKFDLNGTKLWEARHPSAGGGMANKVRIDGSGNVIVAGYAANAIDKDIYLAKYAPTGALLWDRTYNGGYDDVAGDLYVDQGGDVYITGYSYNLATAEDFFTARYSGSSGSVLWQQLLDGGNNGTDQGTALAVDEAGDLFVTGYSVSAGNSYNVLTAKYRRDTGNLLWQSTFTGAGSNQRPVGIALSGAGEPTVGGWSDSGGSNGVDYFAIKYDPGLLNPPTNLSTTTLSDTSITLNWSDNSANETGFVVERRLGDSGTYAVIATLAAGSTGFTDPASTGSPGYSGLTPNNMYYYRVRAYNGGGYSHYSNEAKGLTVYVTFAAPAWSFLGTNPDGGDDYASGVAVGPDNNPVITGYTQRNVGGFDYLTLKLSRADKSVIWSDLYDDPDSEMDMATCVAVDGNNNATVSGFSQLFSAAAQKNVNSIFTTNYPAQGPPTSWGVQYNGPGAIDDRAVAVANTVDGANNVVVTGYGKNSANNDDIYLVKYNAGGTLLWAATPFNGGGEDIPTAVATGADGSIYLTGYSERSAGSGLYNLFTAKYNGATGALVWYDSYTPTPGGNNRANSLALDAWGDLYVTGWSLNAAGDRDIYTIKYSGSAATPQRVWERSVDGPAHGNDDAVSVKVDPIDGNVVVAGSTLTGSGDHDATLIRYSAAGDLVWQKTLLRPGYNDLAAAMTLDPSGSIYLAANTWSGGVSHVISLIYGYDGTLLGASSFAGAGNDEANALAVNYLGEAFIAGYSTAQGGNLNYLLMKQTNPYNVLVPAPFAAAPQSDYSKMILSWSANSAGATYKVERTLGPLSANSQWILINSAAAGTVSFTDSGLNPGTNYCYRIEATVGSLSSRKVVTCATTTLTAPVANQTSPVSSGAIDVSWGDVSGNTGYKVERSTDNATWSQIGGNLAAGTTLYHDTGLSAGTVYYYRVSALNSAGASLPSTVQAAPALNAPSSVTASGMTVGWPAVSGSSGYMVERSTDNVNWTQVATPGSGVLTFTDSALNAATTYYYRVRSVSGSAVSGPSLAQSATTKLVSPVLSAAPATTTSLALSWTDPNPSPSVNESGFLIEYGLCNYGNPNSCAVTTDSYFGSWSSTTAAANANGITLSGLSVARTYRVRVTATLTGANSAPSNVVAVTTALVGPTNLSASATSSSVAHLTWSDVAGETNYRVLLNGTILTGVTLTNGSTSYDVTGLSAGSSYTFQVQPYNATSFANSNQVSLTMPVTPPVVNAPAIVSQSEIDLSWTDVPGIVSYEVWRALPYSQYSPSGSWYAFTLLATVPAGTVLYQDTSVSAGYSYKYKVRYKLSDGSYSAYSAPQQVTTLPAVPTGLVATASSSTQYTFSWTNQPGPTGYNLQYKVRSGSDCSTESWTGVTNYTTTSTSYYAYNISAGQVYCFHVNAYNGAGTTAWSSAGTKLPAPTLNTATTLSMSQVSLSWGDVAGNTGYRVERSTDGYSFYQTGSNLGAGVTSFTDSGLTNNTLYYYRVRTLLGTDQSAPSNVKSTTTTAAPVPVLNAPSGVAASQMVLSWNATSGNTGFKLERSPDNTTWTQIATTGVNVTSYTDTGLSAGTLYYYRVSANTSAGYSATSNVQSATTTPVAPVLTVSGASEAAMNLSWLVIPGATNYKVLRSVGSAGPFSQVANVALAYSASYCGYTLPTVGCATAVAMAGSYLDIGLTENVTYCYRLTAGNSTGGDSAPSPTVCLKTPSVNAPTVAAASAVNSRVVRVSWNYDPAACAPAACGSADGFEVWRQLANGDWALWVTVFSATSAYDSANIEPQRSYAYKVRAFHGADYSAYSAPATVTTPAYSSLDTNCVSQ